MYVNTQRFVHLRLIIRFQTTFSLFLRRWHPRNIGDYGYSKITRRHLSFKYKIYRLRNVRVCSRITRNHRKVAVACDQYSNTTDGGVFQFVYGPPPNIKWLNVRIFKLSIRNSYSREIVNETNYVRQRPENVRAHRRRETHEIYSNRHCSA